MSGEKSTEPQAHAADTDGFAEETLESVSGGLSIIDTGCIPLSPDEPIVCPIEPLGPIVAF